jgi:hypothetical protein
MFIEDTHDGSQIEKVYWPWKVEVDMKVMVAIIFNKNRLCKVPLIHRKLKCSEELHVFLTQWIRFPDSRLLEAPLSFSRYSAKIVHIHIIVTFLFWFHLAAFWLQTPIRLRPQIEDLWMMGITAFEFWNLISMVLLPSRLHWWISANPQLLSLAKIIVWLSPPKFIRIKWLYYWRETKNTYARRGSIRKRLVLFSVADVTGNNELEGMWNENVCHNLSISACPEKNENIIKPQTSGRKFEPRTS